MTRQVAELKGNVGPVPKQAHGFDTDTKLNAIHLTEFRLAGYKFVIRYLTLGDKQDIGADLDYHEASEILKFGLGLMPVQHVRYPGWEPTKQLGQQDGENTRANAYYVGFPPHVNVWLDLEGIKEGENPQDVIDYCNTWYDAVNEWGYVPGLYVGANTQLTGDQLYSLKFQHYWKSLSTVPDVPTRGYQIIQSQGSPFHGVSIDRNIAQADDHGESAIWLHK